MSFVLDSIFTTDSCKLFSIREENTLSLSILQAEMKQCKISELFGILTENSVQ